MRLLELFKEDDAVSPVIGVILMVAITVILAAVIASFVLGLGQQQDVSPSASFSFNYDQSVNYAPFDGNLTINHNSGDPVISTELYLRGEGFDVPTTNRTWAGYADNSSIVSSVSGSADSEPAVVAGDRLKIGANADYEIDIVWESTEGTSSNTLASDSGPDA